MPRLYGSTLLGFAMLALVCALPVAGQVAIDGTTSTTVTVGTNGAVTVGIAPVTRNGVSFNRFEEFNVPREGLSFDNRVEAARTIVNEVTGQNISVLRGDVDVLGQRAHVIIANPNGIVIDGTRFFNTGRIALTTGKIGNTDRLIAPLVTQMNVTSAVDTGTIRIEGGGLAGQMDAVDIIAHKIMVAGEIRNDAQSPNAGIRLIAGRSRTEFESSVIPGNAELNWGTAIPASAAQSDAVLIEILRPGTLRANRIGIQVTEAGAGVRMAGNALATSREFSLTSTGNVTVVDAIIVGTSRAALSGSQVILTNTSIDSPNGSVVINTGREGLSLTTTRLIAADILLSSQGGMAFSKSMIEANAGSLTVTSGQGLSFSESAMIAANSVFVGSDKNTTISDSTVTARGNVVIDASALSVVSVANRSTVVAENGSLLIQTRDGDLVNDGGLLQGAIVVPGVATNSGTQAEGAVTLNVAGSLRNRSDAQLAVIFGLADTVSIYAGANVENTAGRISAGGDIKVIAAGDVLNFSALPNGTLTPKITTQSRPGKRLWWTFWLRNQRITETIIDYGAILGAQALATIAASGSLTVTADEIVNRGGSLATLLGDIHLRAVRVETIGLGFGRVRVTRVCSFSCKSSSNGASGFQKSGVFAGGSMTISASRSMTNFGSVIAAHDNITIASPDVIVKAQASPMYIQRPGGLYNLFMGPKVWVYMRDYFGVIAAAKGVLKIESTAPVKLSGGSLDGVSVVIAAGRTVVRPPSDLAIPRQKMIGWFKNLPLIRN